jgi:hypothetical protein
VCSSLTGTHSFHLVLNFDILVSGASVSSVTSAERSVAPPPVLLSKAVSSSKSRRSNPEAEEMRNTELASDKRVTSEAATPGNTDEKALAKTVCLGDGGEVAVLHLLELLHVSSLGPFPSPSSYLHPAERALSSRTEPWWLDSVGRGVVAREEDDNDKPGGEGTRRGLRRARATKPTTAAHRT